MTANKTRRECLLIRKQWLNITFVSFIPILNALVNYNWYTPSWGYDLNWHRMYAKKVNTTKWSRDRAGNARKWSETRIKTEHTFEMVKIDKSEHDFGALNSMVCPIYSQKWIRFSCLNKNKTKNNVPVHFWFSTHKHTYTRDQGNLHERKEMGMFGEMFLFFYSEESEQFFFPFEM